MHTLPVEPYDFDFGPPNTALHVINMQRDFLLKGDCSSIKASVLDDVQASVTTTERLFSTFRQAGPVIFHTEEDSDLYLSGCPFSRLTRQAVAHGSSQHARVIGARAEMARVLFKVEYEHDSVEAPQPWPKEVVFDNPERVLLEYELNGQAQDSGSC